MLDHKQRHLIDSWMGLAASDHIDSYMRFMALWIAFNAYCYAHYASEANSPRADLRDERGIASATAEARGLTGTIQNLDNRVRINISAPGPIKITIAPKYTEDRIFTIFAARHEETFDRLRQDTQFIADLEGLQLALQKRSGEYYVINMAKIAEYHDTIALDTMAAKSTIVRFNDNANLRALKNVLYQIRCNLFHGEKIPGDFNDDRIVNAATPVLRSLLMNLLELEVES